MEKILNRILIVFFLHSKFYATGRDEDNNYGDLHVNRSIGTVMPTLQNHLGLSRIKAGPALLPPEFSRESPENNLERPQIQS